MIKIDANGYVEDYHIILAKRNHDIIGELVVDKESVVSKVSMNAANELSFKVYKYGKDKNEGEITPHWDDITDFKYVYVQELDEFYEITVEGTEEESEYKSVTGTSACEAELANCKLFDVEINSEDDIKREDYKSPTIFYSELEPQNSLLNRILYKLPQYSIGHVDKSLMKIQRTFSVDNTDVYEFLTQTVAEEVGCLFTFDSVNRKINAYDLKNVCLDCGYRGEYTDTCPKCGSTNLKFYGEDTTVYVDSENLADNITHSVDTDQYKNCFKLRAGDDNMTAAVINCNPNGTDYLYYFSDECKKDMSQELVAKIESYDKLVQSYTKEYSELMQNMYEYIDKAIYYTSSMMPKRENDPTDAKKEGAKLNATNLSPLGMPELKASTSVETINTAMKQYAKVFIKAGYFKADIKNATFYMNGNDGDANSLYGTWTGQFVVTNYSDEEDTYTTPMVTVKVTNRYYDFLQQKIDKKLKDEDTKKDGSIYDVLSIKELTDYKEAIKLYCLNRLKSFADAFQGAIDIMIESDQANKNAELYEELYVPYYEKLVATNNEIDLRTKTIKEYEAKLDVAEKRQREIQKTLNFEKYLGTDLYNEFVLFRREDEYSNDNYISDGLENNEIFKRAQDFIDAAKDELYKSGEKQHKITTSMANLLAIPEFEPLRNNFKLGNFIRVKYDNQVYKLRLLSYQISFGEDIKSLEVEFSDVTKIRTGTSDLSSIIKQAQSIGSTYDSVKTTMKKTSESDSLIRNFVNHGLDATVMKVVNNASNQNMVMGDSGLLMRRQEDFSTQYSNMQLRIINNGLYLTKDAWRSTEACIGQYIHINPETGKQEIGYGVLAKNLVGQMILGNSLGIYSEDSKMQLNFDNHGLVINAKKGDDNTYRRIFDIQKDGKSQLYCDSDGNIVLATNQIIQMGNKLDRVVTDYADIEKLYVKNATLETLLTKYAKIENLEAFKADFKKLVADDAQIKELEAGNVTIAGLLKSQNAEIENIKATKIEASDLEAYKATIEKLLASYATIKQLEADYIKAKDIEATYAKIADLDAKYITTEKLNAATAEINKLIAKKASIEDLETVNATIKTLNVDLANVKKLVATKVNADYVQAEIVKANKVIADDLKAIHGVIDQLDTKYATIEQLKAQRAELDNLIAKKATIKELNTAKATIGQLDAQLANINSILAGNIGTGTLQTVHLTAENVVIDEAVVRDLIAAKINVNDLKAGNISTDRFTIKSDDGGVVIKGSTQQFLDKDGKVRVQIGKDAKGNFNFLVMGADGKTTLYDQDGIKASGVPDGLIVDKMVADNANIQASKVQYIDKDGNTTLQTVIDNQQGKISSLIKETTIDNGDGTTTSLKDAYNQTVQTVEGNKTTIANVKTSVDKVSGKVTKMESSITEIKQTADGVKTTVTANKDKWDKASSDASNAVSTAGTANSNASNALNKASDLEKRANNGEFNGRGVKSTTVEYQASVSGTTAPSGTWSPTVPTVANGSYLWTRTTITYTSGDPSVGYSVARMGVNGAKGDKGASGKDGVSPTVTSTKVEYQQSTNGTTAPTGTWSTTAPTANAGQYMWTKTTVTYSDGKTAISYTVSKNGINGAKGDKGLDGKSPTVSVSKSGATTTITVVNADGSKMTQTVNDGTNGTPGKDGATGKTSYFHVKYSNDGGKTFTANHGETVGDYLGTYTDFVEADSNSVSVYTWVKIKGNTGATGAKGEPGSAGKGISSIVHHYLVTNVTTGITANTSGWKDSPQSVTASNKYLWYYQTINYTVGTPTNTTPAIIGVYGDTGGKGATGKGISSVTPQYYLSTSNTTQTGGSWKTTQDAWSSGKYYWTRDSIAWSDGTTTTTTPTLATGLNNANSTANNAQTIANQTASKFQWIVKSGSSATDFTLTDRTAQLVADSINLHGLVTFKGLDSSTQNKINEASNKIDNLQIGGRNLLMQYIRAGGQTTKINDLSIKVGTGVSDTYFYLKAHQKLIKGEIYTISCDASNVPSGCNWSFGVTAQAATWQLYINKNGRCYATGTPNNDILPGTEFIIDDLKGRPSTVSNIILSNFKLEKGNKATDWTPAPEDKANQSVIDNWAKDSIVGGETTINGGYIKTNTIKTDQLAVEDIFATGSAAMNVINAQEINANRITSGQLSAERINAYGLSIVNKNTNQQTFNITNTGEVSIKGSVSSSNYNIGKTGWSINNDGTAEFNDIIARGSVITNDGGIVSSGGTGRNLLSNSQFLNSFVIENGTACTWQNNVLTRLDNGNANRYGIYYDFTNIKKNTSYAFSINIEELSANGVVNLCVGSSVEGSIWDNYGMINISSIGRRSISFTTKANETKVRLYIASNAKGTKAKLTNAKLEEGSIATDWSPAPEDKLKQVRFWAGTSFEDRESAPFIVYSDGSIKATQGEYSGLWTGDIKIGNISIVDPSSQSGNDALVTIQNGANGIKRVQLTDNISSSFAQDIIITNNTYSPMISLKQDGSAYYSKGINIADKTTLNSTSLIINNKTLTTTSNGSGFLFNNELNVGTANQSANLIVHGNTLTDNITVDNTLYFGHVLKFTKNANGINIDFI